MKTFTEKELREFNELCEIKSDQECHEVLVSICKEVANAGYDRDDAERILNVMIQSTIPLKFGLALLLAPGGWSFEDGEIHLRKSKTA
jgi:hypothetical protein